jgi:hypothetical protein
MELLMVSLMNSRSASANGDNNLQSAEPCFVAANRVGEITGATPVFVAVSRHKCLFLAPVVAAGVAPVRAARIFTFSQIKIMVIFT